jgi:hypothetical protein
VSLQAARVGREAAKALVRRGRNAAMRFKGYLLRNRGRRLAWRDAVNGGRYVGDLVTQHITIGEKRFNLITLRADDPVTLADPGPVCACAARRLPLAIRLRGFERVARGTATYAFGACGKPETVGTARRS